jgi:predicted metal-dependent HD superfamily phosphohydrolase
MKNLFFQIAAKYTQNTSLFDQCWQELTKNYTHKSRHYHSIVHIENMLRLAEINKSKVEDWDTFVMAIFYHDAIYKVLKSDNEEQSALLFEKRMTQINFPISQITYGKELILATKHHQISENETTNLLIDIDLSILGADWEAYFEYTQQIRREYSIYPDLLYKPGRKKVLQRFLERDFIYKTEDFREKNEVQARGNLQKEIDLL